MKRIIKLKFLCSTEKQEIYSRGNKIYLRRKGQEVYIRLGCLPVNMKFLFLNGLRVFQRLFRLEPRCAAVVDPNTIIVSYHGHIYRIDLNKKRITLEHTYRDGMNNPLSFCKINDIDGFDDGILYGEYFGNADREEVNIYLRNACGIWNKVYTFPPGEIQHIHGLVAHAQRRGIFVLTGDSDKESAIWEIKDNFKQVNKVAGGSQTYRSCVAFPCEDGLIYATDTPLEKNALYHLTVKKEEVALNKLMNIKGPSIYGCYGKNGQMAFATSVEPDSTLPRIRYLITKKLGFGVEDNYTHVYIGKQGKGFREIMKCEKDRMPMLLFGFGTFQIPYIGEDELVLTGQSIKKYDGKTIMIKRENMDEGDIC